MKSIELSVVGMQYRMKKEVRSMMAHRLPLKVKLEREPTNAFDSNAIKVVIDPVQKGKSKQAYAGIHIGYIRRDVAEILAPAMNDEEISVHDAFLIEVDAYKGTGVIGVRFAGNLKMIM